MNMQRGEYEIEVRTHALEQSLERQIPWELVKATIYRGKFDSFGKHGVKIWKEFNIGRITCVGFREGYMLKIVTITINRW